MLVSIPYEGLIGWGQKQTADLILLQGKTSTGWANITLRNPCKAPAVSQFTDDTLLNTKSSSSLPSSSPSASSASPSSASASPGPTVSRHSPSSQPDSSNIFEDITSRPHSHSFSTVSDRLHASQPTHPASKATALYSRNCTRNITSAIGLQILRSRMNPRHEMSMASSSIGVIPPQPQLHLRAEAHNMKLQQAQQFQQTGQFERPQQLQELQQPQQPESIAVRCRASSAPEASNPSDITHPTTIGPSQIIHQGRMTNTRHSTDTVSLSPRTASKQRSLHNIMKKVHKCKHKALAHLSHVSLSPRSPTKSFYRWMTPKPSSIPVGSTFCATAALQKLNSTSRPRPFYTSPALQGPNSSPGTFNRCFNPDITRRELSTHDELRIGGSEDAAHTVFDHKSGIADYSIDNKTYSTTGESFLTRSAVKYANGPLHDECKCQERRSFGSLIEPSFENPTSQIELPSPPRSPLKIPDMNPGLTLCSRSINRSSEPLSTECAGRSPGCNDGKAAATSEFEFKTQNRIAMRDEPVVVESGSERRSGSLRPVHSNEASDERPSVKKKIHDEMQVTLQNRSERLSTSDRQKQQSSRRRSRRDMKSQQQHPDCNTLCEVRAERESATLKQACNYKVDFGRNTGRRNGDCGDRIYQIVSTEIDEALPRRKKSRGEAERTYSIVWNQS